MSDEPHISDTEDLNDAAGIGPTVDPRIASRNTYYARKILSLLDEPGMTKSEVARRLGKHPTTISDTMKKPWFLAEQAKWQSKQENRREVAQQISMAGALDALHLKLAAMLEQCADVLEKGLSSEDERVRIDCAKTIIEKAEEAAPENTHDDTTDSLMGQVNKFLPPGDVQ